MTLASTCKMLALTLALGLLLALRRAIIIAAVHGFRMATMFLFKAARRDLATQYAGRSQLSSAFSSTLSALSCRTSPISPSRDIRTCSCAVGGLACYPCPLPRCFGIVPSETVRHFFGVPEYCGMWALSMRGDLTCVRCRKHQGAMLWWFAVVWPWPFLFCEHQGLRRLQSRQNHHCLLTVGNSRLSFCSLGLP
jgi:hypothetical protein